MEVVSAAEVSAKLDLPIIVSTSVKLSGDGQSVGIDVVVRR